MGCILGCRSKCSADPLKMLREYYRHLRARQSHSCKQGVKGFWRSQGRSRGQTGSSPVFWRMGPIFASKPKTVPDMSTQVFSTAFHKNIPHFCDEPPLPTTFYSSNSPCARQLYRQLLPYPSPPRLHLRRSLIAP